jgi:hypothetical protein
MSLIDHSQSKGAISPAGTAQRTASMGSRMRYARLIGALFLAAFVLYGVGFGLVTSVVGAQDFLLTISAQQTTLVLGAVLMLLNSVVVVGLGALFFPMPPPLHIAGDHHCQSSVYTRWTGSLDGGTCGGREGHGRVKAGAPGA